MRTRVKLFVEVFFRLLHYIVTYIYQLYLAQLPPLRASFLASSTAVRTSIYLLSISTFKSLNTLYHFGSSCILSCNSWFSTGCFLDAVQFGFISSHVHHKAHASLEVGF